MNLLNLKVAFRNIRKNGVLSFAKLFGITLAFAVILFASGYVYYETSYDKFMPDYDRIYRCLMTGKLKDNKADFAVTSPAMAAVITNELAEIEESVRFTMRGPAEMYYNGELIEGGNLVFADSNFFSFFGFPVEKLGDNPFQSENSLAISRSMAESNFGSVSEALSAVVRLRGDECMITAVFEDMPDNSHLQFQTIQSIAKTNPDRVGWGSQSYYTYIKTVSDDIDVDDLSFKITKTVGRHAHSELDAENATSWEDLKWDAANYLFYPAEPLKDVHFSNHRFDPAVTANKTYVYGAVILALLVLVISSLNFVNLTVADLTTRYKEIGIHKAAGAFNKQITARFIFESFIYWMAGFLFAGIIYDFAAVPLSKYVDLSIALTAKQLGKIIIISFAGLLIFNLLANILPISFISKKKVLSLIKDENSQRNFSVRNVFMLFQFLISVLIIMCSLIVQKQINYIVEKDRGYNPENVLVFNLWEQDEGVREHFKAELRKHACVQSVSSSATYFGQDPGMNSANFDNTDQENYFHTSVFYVDEDFIEAFQIEIAEGRSFEKGRKADERAVLVNEAVLKEYRNDTTLINKEIYLGGGDPYRVIGMVKDFNYRSLHHPLLPLVIRLSENSGNIMVRTTAAQIPETISVLEKLWSEFNINRPFDFEYHDDIVIAHYEKDQQAKKILLVLSIISIAIACIGLYAISFFIMMRRTKEIGIRKVNGATIANILVQLNKSFLTWVLVAYLIAVPIAWYLMNSWLANFAYRTELSWWVFSLAGALAMGIAFVTLSWQSWRTATRNPVEALRYE